MECGRVLKKQEGRLVFSFHHWDKRAWSSLTKALMHAGFKLDEFHIVHSENPISVHIASMRSLTDDAILFLSTNHDDGLDRWNRPERIRYTNSAAFCQDCATMLGWMLNSELTNGQIDRIWNENLLAR